MLCAPVFYIYIRQLSYFRVPTLGFIDLTVATCHIQCNFLSLCQFFSQENGQNTKICESAIFVWYENGRRRSLGAQSINTERASLAHFCSLDLSSMSLFTAICSKSRMAHLMFPYCSKSACPRWDSKTECLNKRRGVLIVDKNFQSSLRCQWAHVLVLFDVQHKPQARICSWFFHSKKTMIALSCEKKDQYLYLLSVPFWAQGPPRMKISLVLLSAEIKPVPYWLRVLLRTLAHHITPPLGRWVSTVCLDKASKELGGFSSSDHWK